MKKLVIILMVLGLVIGSSSMALATSVSLVPSATDIYQGSTVVVAVDISVSSDITMSAISTNFWYNTTGFEYIESAQGALLTHIWEGWGGENFVLGDTNLRIGAIDMNFDPSYESLADGTSGTLFTFTLRVKDNAPLGYHAITWGVYDGSDNATAGFDYGDATFTDFILPGSDTRINVMARNSIPEPATMLLLGLGLVGLAGVRRKFKK